METINGLSKKEQKRLEKLEAQFKAAGGRGVELAEEIDELRNRRDEPEKAAEVYESLLAAADGGDAANLDTFAAQTIMAMLDDHRYRAKVKKWHESIYG